jgi:hypothetical protein
MVEATALNSMELRSSSMSSPPYKILCHLNPHIGSKVIKGFLCTHVRSLNVLHIGMAEATRIKDVASRSSSMASSAYQIS